MLHVSRRFQRRTEDFKCERCSLSVKGNGYTNHCPGCLWSKHVDVLPGDRNSGCNCLMEPVAVLKKNGRYTVLHRCLGCGLEKPNKVAADDNFEELIGLARMGDLVAKQT